MALRCKKRDNDYQHNYDYSYAEYQARIAVTFIQLFTATSAEFSPLGILCSTLLTFHINEFSLFKAVIFIRASGFMFSAIVHPLELCHQRKANVHQSSVNILSNRFKFSCSFSTKPSARRKSRSASLCPNWIIIDAL